MSLKTAEVITKEEANELELDMKKGQIRVTSFRGLSVYRSVGPSLALSRSVPEETARHSARRSSCQ